MPYVVSTLTNSQEYANYIKPPSDGIKVARPATQSQAVVIKGGANVQGVIRTPEGVLTQITEEQAKFLGDHPVFQRHQKRGYVKIVTREVNPDKVAAKDLEARDESAPLNEAHGDFKPGGRAGGDERDPDQAPLKII